MKDQTSTRHNARGSIGIDTDYLDKQIEEKRLRDAQVAEREKQDAECIREFSKRLDEYEKAANFKKSQQLHDFRRTLAEQVRQPKNNALADGKVELDKCGASSIQIFDGEDEDYGGRKKIQQQQLQGWCSELMAEKERARHEERMKEKEYATHIIQTDQVLEHMGTEVMRRKQERAKLQQLENMKMAREAELRRELELLKEKEASDAQTCHLQNCQLLTEDKSVATNQMQPHRVRPDHYKGFGKEEIRRIFQDNDAILEEKKIKCAQETAREADWAKYESEMLQRMDEAEYLRQQRIAKENREYGNTLQRQREEFRMRNAKTEVTEIGTGFFERFGQGQSCR